MLLHVTNRRESDPGHTIMSMAIASEVEQSAIIEVTAKDPAIPNRKLTGIVRTNEKKILTAITDEAITGSAAVRVQTKDLLSFGEVLGCSREQDAKWTVYVGVKRRILIV
jgi:hypothetical protein